MKKRVDPFGNNNTPSSNVGGELPVRGIGLENGNAGERRGGNPRTEEERAVRHEVMDDSSDKGIFKKIEVDGITHYRREGFENVEIPKPELKPPQTLKDQWAEHRANKRVR